LDDNNNYRIQMHGAYNCNVFVATTMKKALRGDANTVLAVVRQSQFLPCCRPPSRGCGTAKI